MLQAEQNGDNAEFLTVLYPRSLDQGEPAVAEVATEGGQALQVSISAGQDIAWVRDAAAIEVIFEGPAGKHTQRRRVRSGAYRRSGSHRLLCPGRDFFDNCG